MLTLVNFSEEDLNQIKAIPNHWRKDWAGILAVTVIIPLVVGLIVSWGEASKFWAPTIISLFIFSAYFTQFPVPLGEPS